MLEDVVVDAVHHGVELGGRHLCVFARPTRGLLKEIPVSRFNPSAAAIGDTRAHDTDLLHVLTSSSLPVSQPAAKRSNLRYLWFDRAKTLLIYLQEQCFNAAF
jgi:hypothetical protein